MVRRCAEVALDIREVNARIKNDPAAFVSECEENYGRNVKAAARKIADKDLKTGLQHHKDYRTTVAKLGNMARDEIQRGVRSNPDDIKLLRDNLYRRENFERNAIEDIKEFFGVPNPPYFNTGFSRKSNENGMSDTLKHRLIKNRCVHSGKEIDSKQAEYKQKESCKR